MNISFFLARWFSNLPDSKLYFIDIKLNFIDDYIALLRAFTNTACVICNAHFYFTHPADIGFRLAAVAEFSNGDIDILYCNLRNFVELRAGSLVVVRFS